MNKAADPSMLLSDLQQTIYRSPDIRVVYQPADSDFLVFTFNGLKFRDQGHGFFGDSFMADRGIAAVGIVSRRPTWFPEAHMRDALAAIHRRLPANAPAKRLTYGVSMGAYAAVKYGARLGASAALSFAPQMSIDPDVVGAFDGRFATHFSPKLHRGMEIAEADLCPRNFIVYDPLCEPDQEHVRRLAALGGIDGVIGPFSGHPALGVFTQLHLVEPYLRLAARGDAAAREFRTLLRANRARSPRYWFGRAELLHQRSATRRLDIVVQSYQRALDIPDAFGGATHAAALIGLIEVLYRARRQAQAQPYIQALRKLHEAGVNTPTMVPTLMRVGGRSGARDTLQLAISRTPRDPVPHLELARLLLDGGDRAGANAAVDSARALLGRDIRGLRRMVVLCERLHRTDDGAAAQAELDALGRTVPGRGGALPPPPRRPSPQA